MKIFDPTWARAWRGHLEHVFLFKTYRSYGSKTIRSSGGGPSKTLCGRFRKQGPGGGVRRCAECTRRSSKAAPKASPQATMFP